MAFVPLHVHSQYSILDATASPKALAMQAKRLGYQALGLTDHGNLYGAVDFFTSCQSVGIKPIIGCELYVANESRSLKRKCPETGRASFHLTLLAKDSQGYRNLCKLSSIGFLEGFYFTPRVDWDTLQQHAQGLVCLSGDMGSKAAYLALYGKPGALETWITQLSTLYGENFFLEVSSHEMTPQEIAEDGMEQEPFVLKNYEDYIAHQRQVNQMLLDMGKAKGIGVVATTDTHYLDRSDWKGHETLLNIGAGELCEVWERDSMGNPKQKSRNPKRKMVPSHAFHLRSYQEMERLFGHEPSVLHQTLEIAKMCDVVLDFETKHYPVYIPETLKNQTLSEQERKQAVESYLWTLCREGIPKRYTPERLAVIQQLYPDQDPLDVVETRLKEEMAVIVPKEMCDYLLLVWDFIHWAKGEGIPVGPGRGSGAGSIVLYLIGITDIEPLRFSLFFERFINPERFSYPDIDVDICMERRAEVLKYTLDKYGRDNVAQIITFGTMKAKMTVKDVGRVLNVSLSKVNQIAKLIPDDLDITLEKALERDPELKSFYERDEEARQIIDLGRKIEGSIRNTGIHAAGLVISGDPLTDHIPITVVKDSDMPATQFSMKPVESVGMLKVDFLGLKTLTSIRICCEAIEKRCGVRVDWMNLPLDDPDTFTLLNQGKTLGVFQLESGGMQDLAKQLHLDTFEEIIAVLSLYRPGPMEMIPSFLERKHGREEIEMEHPWMEPILKETYGIMVYQEQVMQIAQKLANYSLGEGDILRRAMGKKDKKQMQAQREKFRKGCVDNGIDEDVAMQIFDKMEKFASYGFNKSHAAAYGYITYVTAYLKANYPKDWMAALMTSDAHDITKVAKFIGEAKAMGIEVLSPSVNTSQRSFFATDEGIRFGLGGIKGVGDNVVEHVLENRQEKGVYKNLHHFIERVDLKQVGKKQIELLVEAGCFGFTQWSKDALLMSVEPMYERRQKQRKEESLGYMNLFAALEEEHDQQFATPPEVTDPTPRVQMLFKEKELLGFFLSGHPLETYRDTLERVGVVSLSQVLHQGKQEVLRTAFLIEEVKTRFSQKSGKKFSILTISDQTSERFELPVWPDVYEERGHLLVENRMMLAVIMVEQEQKLSCQWFDDLTLLNDAQTRFMDEEYDRAKKRLENRREFFKEGGTKRKTPKKEVDPLCVQIDLETCRLSHLLEIKEIFRSHPGNTPVHVEFMAADSLEATLVIDKPWGIKLTSEIKKKVQMIPSFLRFSVHKCS